MGEHTGIFSRRSLISTGAAFCAAFAVTAAAPRSALAVPTAAEKRAEAAAALDSLNAMQEKLDIASNNYFAALTEQEEAEKKMAEAQARIEEATAQILELQKQLGTRARSMYRSGSTTFLDLLLGSTTFKAFTTNWDLLNDMNENDAEMVRQTKELKAEIEEQKKVYEEQARIAAEKTAEAAAIKEEAEALVAQQQAIYDALSAEAAELLAQERAAREAAALQSAQQGLQNGGNSDNSSNSNNSNSNVNNSKPQSVSGSAVVSRAYAEIGKPYEWGAEGPDSFDCSGFVSYCISGRYGTRLGTASSFQNLTRVTEPQPGDICTTGSHCGIYIGGGQMIHAPETGKTVCISAARGIYVRY